VRGGGHPASRGKLAQIKVSQSGIYVTIFCMEKFIELLASLATHMAKSKYASEKRRNNSAYTKKDKILWAIVLNLLVGFWIYLYLNDQL